MTCACADLDDDLINRRPSDLPALAATLAQLVQYTSPTAGYWRCRECGTIWQESVEPFMHADVPILARTTLDARGAPVMVRFDLKRTTPRMP